jgi:hypothetical protein
MDNKELHKLLHQLQDEINNTQTDSEKDRELLRELDGDVRALLDCWGDNCEDLHPSFAERLESTINQFEVSHPQLTMVVGKTLESLSAAGI